MENTDYIEHMEESDKTRRTFINGVNEYFEKDEKVKIETTDDKEYFEEDVKTEKKEHQDSNRGYLKRHIEAHQYGESWKSSIDKRTIDEVEVICLDDE